MDGTGKCLCGIVRFSAQDIETHIHACHCSMCRRWNGGPAMAASAGSVSFEGEENIIRYASSDWAERGFCKRCGSNLFYFLKPDKYIMWAGAFDEQPFSLDGEIFCSEKPTWYDFIGDHPRHKELPDA